MSHGRRLGDSSHDATDPSINDTFNHVNPAHNQTRYQSMSDSPKPSMGAPIQPYSSDTNGQSTTPPLIPALHSSSRGSSRTSPLINPQFNQTMRMNHSPMSQTAPINASINQSPLVGRRQSVRSVGSSRIVGHRVDENGGDYVSPQSVNPHLYTPKPSPGMRTQYGQSPAPNPAMNQSINQSISANYSELPALDATHRYVMVGTLQQSLFGIVKLAYDRLINQLVAIKISRLNRAINQTTRSGVSVLENVRREAAIMQYLAETSARKRWLKLLNQQSVKQAVDSLNQSKQLMNPLTGRRSLYADMFVGVSLSDLLPDPSLNSSLSPDNNLLTHQIAARRHTLSSRAINRKLPANNQMMDDDEDAAHVSPLIAHLMNNQSIASTAKNSPHDSPAMTTSLPLLNPTPMTDQPVINLLNSHVALENGNASMYQAINQPSAPIQRNSAEVEQKENPPPSDGEQVIDYFYSSSMGAVPIPTHINPTLNQAINEALIELTAQLYDDEPVTSGIPHSHHPLELRWRARMTQRSASPNSQQSIQQSILDDLEGESYICGYHSSFEDSSYHYLLIDFIPGGDLYSMLTSFPCHRLSESCARWVFRQMVCGVLYLHVRGVAHLDMSLENMCLDAFDDVRVIDFGVAAVHPHATTAYLHSGAAASTWSQATPPPPDSNININSHTKQPLTPHPPRSFMCRAVSDMSAKPGKIRYMSPELFQGAPWDAFANDVFSLGVILYSLLTGRPPFQQAYDSDLWFKVIYTGTWLTPQIRSQQSAHVFTHLSDDALDLINCIIKPQSQRPTCEQILQHRFMLRED